ncbi:hypothetical protein GALMADRAFT_131490, partial [Galerina marginata CBS 339.88]
MCIARGRSSQRRDCEDYYEALRLFGSALHTLEDFLAHTNWCELAIKKLSTPEANVFCFAGAETYIPIRSGELVPPLVTGSFGGEDIYVSLFGTVDDKLCSRNSGDIQKIRASGEQNSMGGLNKLLKRLSKNDPKLKGHLNKIADAKKLGEEHKLLLKARLEKPKAPQAGDEKPPTPTEIEIEREKRRVKARAEFRETSVIDYIPDESSNPAFEIIWDIIEIRDDIVRAILEVLDKIGLKEWMDKINEIINKAVWTIIAGIVTPALDGLTSVVDKGHEDLLYVEKQTKVFTKADCSDPTHSWLAKDHFKNSLHLPAAKVAEVVVEDCVRKITAAWTNQTDPDTIINEILETLHHPYFPKEGSAIQAAMFQEMKTYWNNLGDSGKANLLSVLTLEAVHQGKNIRDIPRNPGSVGSGVGDVISDVLNFGVNIADKVLEELFDAINLALELVDDIVEGVEMVVDKAKEVVHEIGEGLDKIGQEAEKAVKDIGNGIEGAIDDVEKAAINVYDGADEVVTDIGRGIENGVTDIGSGVGEIANGIGNGVEELVTDVGK